MSRSTFFALLWAVLQVGDQAPPTGTIQGIVLRQDTSEPIQDVQVTLNASAPAGQRGTPPVMVFTDSRGRFIISNVPVGIRPLQAQRRGYFAPPISGVSSGVLVTTTTVTAGQTTDVRLLMTPGGAISGKVFDTSGKAITDAQVQALRLRYQNGVLAPEAMGFGTTDDRGEYRIFRLPPAEYFVAVLPTRPANPASPIPVRTFYPSIEDLRTAVPIVLHGGDELPGLDIRVRVTAGARVSGKVISALPPGPAVRPRTTSAGTAGEVRPSIAEVSLIAQNEALPTSVGATSVTALPDGSFEIQNVVPGTYDLVARLPVTVGWGDMSPPPFAVTAFAFGRTSVVVRGSSLENIEVSVHSGTDLHGTVLVNEKQTPAAVRVVLEPDDGAFRSSFFSPYVSQVAAFEPGINQDGSFMIPLVPEGHYRVRALLQPPQLITQPVDLNTVREPQVGLTTLPAGTYLADVRQAGVSIYDNGLSVSPRGDAPIEILMRTNSGSVEGMVLRKDQKPAPGATVTLVPETQRRQNPALYSVGRTDAQGKFTFSTVPPGNYKVFAWETVQGAAYQNPAFIEKFEQRGIAVAILPGTRSNANVGLITNEDLAR